MSELIEVLMKRDGLSYEEARDMAREARKIIREALENGEDPEEAFTDFTGLEPDYLEELL